VYIPVVFTPGSNDDLQEAMSAPSSVFKDYTERAPSVQQKTTVEPEGVLHRDRGSRDLKWTEKNEKKKSPEKVSKQIDTCLMYNHQLTQILYRLACGLTGLIFDCIYLIGNLRL
jgi:hypothetical protein